MTFLEHYIGNAPLALQSHLYDIFALLEGAHLTGPSRNTKVLVISRLLCFISSPVTSPLSSMTVSKERQAKGRYIFPDQGIKQWSSGFCENAKQWTSVICYRC